MWLLNFLFNFYELKHTTLIIFCVGFPFYLLFSLLPNLPSFSCFDCSIVPESKYQLVTSYIRAVVLLGMFLGALLAQILVSLFAIDYFYLNVIAFVNISIGFTLSLFLPMPKSTLFFYATSKSSKASTELMPKEENRSSENYSVETVKVNLLLSCEPFL